VIKPGDQVRLTGEGFSDLRGKTCTVIHASGISGSPEALEVALGNLAMGAVADPSHRWGVELVEPEPDELPPISIEHERGTERWTPGKSGYHFADFLHVTLKDGYFEIADDSCCADISIPVEVVLMLLRKR
jgi:hypothetical protein